MKTFLNKNIILILLMDDINIELANLNISKLKYPIVFLFNLLNYKEEIGDYNLSIIMKLFLRNHVSLILNYNIMQIFEYELSNYILTSTLLVSFLKLFKKKMSLVVIIKQWYELYDNKKFWSLDIKDQLLYINDIKMKFLAIFDLTFVGSTPFHNKIKELLNDHRSNKEIILDEIKRRLRYILKLFNSKIFKSLDIPVLAISDFDTLTNEEIHIYLTVVFTRFIKLLNETTAFFENYSNTNNELNELLNIKEPEAILTEEIDSKLFLDTE